MNSLVYSPDALKSYIPLLPNPILKDVAEKVIAEKEDCILLVKEMKGVPSLEKNCRILIYRKEMGMISQEPKFFDRLIIGEINHVDEKTGAFEAQYFGEA